MDDSLSIFDSVSSEFLDMLQLVLMETAAQSHLPEIFKVFGKESVLKFIDIFSGTTITVPKREVIENCMRDVSILLQMRKVGADSQATLVRDLAVRYNMTAGQVRRVFVDMEERLKRYKFEKTNA